MKISLVEEKDQSIGELWANVKQLTIHVIAALMKWGEWWQEKVFEEIRAKIFPNLIKTRSKKFNKPKYEKHKEIYTTVTL